MTTSRPTPKQGEVWDAFLDPAVGHEQAGRRPVLILSTNVFNELPSSLCVIVPITSRSRGIPLHVPIEKGEAGLTSDSFILCDQIRSISHSRLKRLRGNMSGEAIQRVNSVLGLMLRIED